MEWKHSIQKEPGKNKKVKRRCTKIINYITCLHFIIHKTNGRHSRHSRANYIIKRALGVINFNARLEPENLSSAAGAEGLVPDGVTQYDEPDQTPTASKVIP
jgi:hypothetical protein